VKKIKPSGFQEELPMQGKGGQKVDMPPWSCICARNFVFLIPFSLVQIATSMLALMIYYIPRGFLKTGFQQAPFLISRSLLDDLGHLVQNRY